MQHSSSLDPESYKRLLIETCEVAAGLPAGAIAIVGPAEACEALRADLKLSGLVHAVGPVLTTDLQGWQSELSRLASEPVQVIVIAANAEKERYLRLIALCVMNQPRVLVAGYEHFEFAHPIYEAALAALDEPSLANGYRHSRVHLFQCLQNAARRGLDGLVVEFGMFRGGTTMFLCEVVERLGQAWSIVGFDSFNGFPPRDHLFDLYDHPDLYNVSYAEVLQRFAGRNVQVVAGDLRTTAAVTIAEQPVVVAFVDTDNYSSGIAAISAVKDNIVPGGAIVLDHYTGEDRFVRTIGERMAAEDLLDGDSRYFNLHGTGVFIRQC